MTAVADGAGVCVIHAFLSVFEGGHRDSGGDDGVWLIG